MRRYPCRVVLLLATVSSLSLSFSPEKLWIHHGHALSSSRFIKKSPQPNFRFGRHLLSMVMKVTVRIVGRKSGGWLDEGYSMYQKRLRPSGVDVETTWHKSDDALIKGVRGDYDKGVSVVMLDPKGNTYTSEKLAVDMFKWIELGGSRLVFVIGGGECSLIPINFI